MKAIKVDEQIILFLTPDEVFDLTTDISSLEDRHTGTQEHLDELYSTLSYRIHDQHTNPNE